MVHHYEDGEWTQAIDQHYSHGWVECRPNHGNNRSSGHKNKLCHCTVKRIAARIHCLIEEAVYWHNVTPQDSVSPPTAPANKIYHYEVRVKGADAPITSSGPGHSYYQVGNHVWFKTVQNRCTTKFGKCRVTKVISPQSVKDLWHSVTSLEEDSDCKLLRVGQKAYCVTPKIQNQTIRLRKEPWRNPLLCLCIEALGESGCRQTAMFVIMRSGGSVAREETYLWDQSS